jgi:hypothetical protein
MPVLQSVSPQTLATTTGLTCITGRVNLFTFIQAPSPGSVLGTVTTTSGQQFNLVQTSPTATPLSQADNQFVTLCGRFRQIGGRLVFDV